MFDQMMDLVKDQVTKSIGGISGIPAGKQSAVVETTANSLLSGLKQNASLDSLGALLGGGGASSSTVSKLSSGVVKALTSKLKLSPAVAQTVASTVIPAVMSLLNKRVNDKGEPGFNLESILGSLKGGGASKSSGGLGGLLGGLGGLFGKK
jgi:hypothetical protein